MMPIKYANFTNNGTVLGAVNADKIDVQDRKTAYFDHNVFNAELAMHGANATAKFNSKVTINSPIKGNGLLYFQDGAVINDRLGTIARKLSQVHFNGNIVVDSNIYSKKICFNNSTLTLNENVEFNGATTFNNAKIILNNDLIIKNGDVELIGTTVINTVFDGTRVNNIVASCGSNIKLTGSDTLLINIDDSSSYAANGTVITPLIVDTAGALNIDVSNIAISSTRPTSNWVASLNDDELILTQHSDISGDSTTGGITKPINNQPASDWVASLNDDELVLSHSSEASDNNIASRVANFTDNQLTKNSIYDHTEKLKSLVDKITSSVDRAATASIYMAGQAEKSILNRTMGHQVSLPFVVATINNDNIIGVSSGDSPEKYGIWGSTFYSKNIQKARNTSAGYQSHSYGGTFGFDTKISEDSLVGFAFSVTDSKIKHKDFNAGDKTDIVSYLLSAYANQDLSSNWFGQEILSIGSSKVSNKDSRSVGVSIQTATGNYNSVIFSTEVLVGYNHTFSNRFTVTPIFSLSYYRINSQKYKETGPANMQLFDVNKMISHKLDTIAGVKFTSPSITTGSLMVIPEAHMFISHDLIAKYPNTTFQLNGINIKTQKPKLQRIFYNLGGSLDIEYGATDYIISVDTNFAPKYVGIQGSLKVRVNF